ncbi:Protein of unknown function [Lactobacillus acidophilus DSM 9126]|nr:Protein of unknown function [Lactobacillus acidophilus DSM 20079 = JCM 1132 = NBRC 13951 = CIP 76.13]CDF70268.1 Protein of unknown function [Lactobacillus acidophilus CIRM-BIA 442]CDF72064.1 Protein of unknown function [Lactobacillus acidophilus CIRM-BIA 445]CDF73886.1 Protein of unknown function [Lactobacillus acidophilus DSM 9126]CDF75890.1 Protein of unknown function [Lactobacillus acidophilus DSM 20242]
MKFCFFLVIFIVPRKHMKKLLKQVLKQLKKLLNR